jgi:hypothetical protein
MLDHSEFPGVIRVDHHIIILLSDLFQAGLVDCSEVPVLEPAEGVRFCLAQTDFPVVQDELKTVYLRMGEGEVGEWEESELGHVIEFSTNEGFVYALTFTRDRYTVFDVPERPW